MAYTIDLADAARRHRDAADCLYAAAPPCRRRDVAGYLYGLAAECAVKQILRRSTNWRAPERDDDAFWAHFPELKALVRDSAQGRYAGVLVKLCENAGFMKWRADASEAIAAMEGC